jgi:hypothetical protein
MTSRQMWARRKLSASSGFDVLDVVYLYINQCSGSPWINHSGQKYDETIRHIDKCWPNMVVECIEHKPLMGGRPVCQVE